MRRRLTARKRSISLSPQTAVLLERRGKNYSASIRAMIAGYDRMVSCGLTQVPEWWMSGHNRMVLFEAWSDLDVLQSDFTLVLRRSLPLRMRRAARKMDDVALLALYDIVLQARTHR